MLSIIFGMYIISIVVYSGVHKVGNLIIASKNIHSDKFKNIETEFIFNIKHYIKLHSQMLVQLKRLVWWQMRLKILFLVC
ncbi:MAG: hypothetical protein COB17_08155 [Sulfurimonas sp.]|nr:MAG: hypothetical protein COB17_08155 [Sulfurimonas sp.]